MSNGKLDLDSYNRGLDVAITVLRNTHNDMVEIRERLIKFKDVRGAAAYKDQIALLHGQMMHIEARKL